MVCTSDGLLHIELKKILYQFAYTVLEKNYSVTNNIELLQTGFSNLKAVSMRLVGSRKKINLLPLEDRANLI